ncbi:hypothetical protein ILUMI_07168, partial [Ignelater luminosus]
VNISVEILAVKDYVYLFSVRENKACDAMHKYLGEFIYTVERAVGLIPRACPIPKILLQNNYYFYNLPIDANKITTASNFPFGNLRITLDFLDGKNRCISCTEMKVENNILHG